MTGLLWRFSTNGRNTSAAGRRSLTSVLLRVAICYPWQNGPLMNYGYRTTKISKWTTVTELQRSAGVTSPPLSHQKRKMNTVLAISSSSAQSDPNLMAPVHAGTFMCPGVREEWVSQCGRLEGANDSNSHLHLYQNKIVCPYPSDSCLQSLFGDGARIRHSSRLTAWSRTALFCAVTQQVVAITYRRFGTICRSRLQESLWFPTFESEIT